jgi:hypothetical protein
MRVKRLRKGSGELRFAATVSIVSPIMRDEKLEIWR